MYSRKLLAVVIYPSAMVVANLSVATFGPIVTPINSFLLIGMDLTLRDWLQAQVSRWSMLVLIGVSGLLSYLLNPASGMIAVASFVAFTVSAIIDYFVFTIAKGSWLRKANTSNSAGAIVDSLLFPTIAFGSFMPTVVLLQVAAKIAGGSLFAWLLNKK